MLISTYAVTALLSCAASFAAGTFIKSLRTDFTVHWIPVFSSAARRWPLADRVLRAMSVLLGLGDTFEAYAAKGRK